MNLQEFGGNVNILENNMSVRRRIENELESLTRRLVVYVL
jgi:hypothetical protein